MAVTTKTRCIVWARAAGRCQFPGCNKLLIGDLRAGNDTLNTAYIAHIVAETAGGPRGDKVRSPLLADDPDNLLLLCDAHHRLIDRDGLDDYPEERLLQIKLECETRIELATDVSPDNASFMVRYAATVGQNEGIVGFKKCREAMLPKYYPANRNPIDFSMSGLNLADSEAGYFELQAQNLQRQFDGKLRGQLEKQEIAHISVFALAPIPLLMELGRLLSDITPTEVYQLHREPAGWRWAESGPKLEFGMTIPKSKRDTIALKLEISSNISDDRVRAALGSDVSIWSLNVSNPHNDCMRHRDDLQKFRTNTRKILADIKEAHGEKKVINIFPAIPVSAAVEFGRVWMPKADLPLHIFDQSRTDDGFIQRLSMGVTS